MFDALPTPPAAIYSALGAKIGLANTAAADIMPPANGSED